MSDCEPIHRLHGRGDTFQALQNIGGGVFRVRRFTLMAISQIGETGHLPSGANSEPTQMRHPRTHGDYRCGKFTTSGQRHTRGLHSRASPNSDEPDHTLARTGLTVPTSGKRWSIDRQYRCLTGYGSHLREAMSPLHGACILYPIIFDRVACACHARGLPFFAMWRKRQDAALAPKMTRRCVPIRGDEHPAAVLLHHSTA